ncbi:MAG TPA: NAD(P)-dependent oxidoreductase [Thermodesulfobacteriota bacterium]|nr:NAD(P)-dependent oxidoreductase [Thermodesulfobacteriota bacterium]
MKIGFIGLGIMGLPMCKRLIQAGYQVIIRDLKPNPVKALKELGALSGNTAREVSAQTDLLITMLPTPAVTREVLLGTDGAIHGLRPGSLYVDMSTSNPTLTKEIHQALKEKGVEMLDAPVSGGMQGAVAGTLTIMVGGDSRSLETAKPVLGCMGNKIVHVGEIGSGHTIKLINNMLFAVNMAATAEALAFGRKNGIDPVVLRDVLNSSSARSFAVDVKVKDFIFPRNFKPGFTVDLHNKDMDLALQLAKDLRAPLLLLPLVRQIYQSLLVKGHEKEDTSVIVTFFEEFMGMEEIRPVSKP